MRTEPVHRGRSQVPSKHPEVGRRTVRAGILPGHRERRGGDQRRAIHRGPRVASSEGRPGVGDPRGDGLGRARPSDIAPPGLRPPGHDPHTHGRPELPQPLGRGRGGVLRGAGGGERDPAGITSEAQREEMGRLGVDLVQGPLVGGSFPPSELSERVGSWGSRGFRFWGSRADVPRRVCFIEPHPRGGCLMGTRWMRVMVAAGLAVSSILAAAPAHADECLPLDVSCVAGDVVDGVDDVVEDTVNTVTEHGRSDRRRDHEHGGRAARRRSGRPSRRRWRRRRER